MVGSAVGILDVYVRFDDARDSSLQKRIDRLRPRSYRTRSSQIEFPLRGQLDTFQLECIACLGFVQAVNDELRDRFASLIANACQRRGLVPPDVDLIRLIYDAGGSFYEIEELRQGSCSARAKRKESNWLAIVSFNILTLLGGQGLAESDVGRSVIEEVRDATNHSTEFIEGAIDRVERDFPFVVRREIDPIMCRVTICLDR